MPRLPSLPPALRFITIGCAAAAVHFAVVKWLVEGAAGMAPLVSNVLGWLSAFGVSFAGHYHWTFAHHDTHWRHALPRFFALSAAGFAINELAYALALHYSPWRYDVLLALVLVGVAVLTYVLGKLWAFRDRTASKAHSAQVRAACPIPCPFQSGLNAAGFFQAFKPQSPQAAAGP